MINIWKFEKNTTHLVAKFHQKLWSEYLNYFDRNSYVVETFTSVYRSDVTKRQWLIILRLSRMINIEKFEKKYYSFGS